jgi:hypothetical protein
MTAPSAPLGTPQHSAATCPYCMWSLAGTSNELDSQVQSCPSCGTQYHADCFTENGGCAVFGCPAWTARQMGLPVVGSAPQIALHNLPAPPPHVAAPAPSAAYQAPPPPPPPPPASNWIPQEAQATQRFCEQCGVMISAEDSFCGGCGSPVHRGSP